LFLALILENPYQCHISLVYDHQVRVVGVMIIKLGLLD
jgi:hypothetical protein